MTLATLNNTGSKWLLAAALGALPVAASAQSYNDPNGQQPQPPYQGQPQYGNQQSQPQYGNQQSQPQYGNQGQYAPQQPGDPSDRQAYDQGYQDGQLSVSQAPPPLPQYDQPECPGDGYIWTPGYWAYGPTGYYWVNGAWVVAPYQGALWTPGFWGFNNGYYAWNAGYWGSEVGFYGGINYGFGYFGIGFYGGYWNGGQFFYNRGYTNVGYRTHSFYEQRYPGFGGVHPGGRSFAPVDRHDHFGGSDHRFGGDDHRVGSNDNRFTGTDHRFGGNDGRSGNNDHRFGANDQRTPAGDHRGEYGNNGSNTRPAGMPLSTPIQTLGIPPVTGYANQPVQAPGGRTFDTRTYPAPVTHYGQNPGQQPVYRQQFGPVQAPVQSVPARPSFSPPPAVRSAPAPSAPPSSGGGFHGSTGGSPSHNGGGHR